ncbi:MAG: hypothetical protein EA351_12850 [Gemmatimonadales bacterium]|nr:MAG: hypothetical protein EA351_12850 [Gemmatimonadales bacterium]
MKWIHELRRLLRRSNRKISKEALAEAVTCEEAAERIFEWLDNELDPELEAKVGAHLETCARCYPFLVFEEAFQEAIAKVEQHETTPGELRDKIMQSLETEGFGSRSSSSD